MANEKILVVDDDQSINKLVCSYLTKEQFVPLSAVNGSETMELIHRENPNLIILDVMLPDTDGTALSLEIRKYTNAPILFLSCKTQEIDKIIALSAGGDDYITKPFMPGELIARIKAHLRRQKSYSSRLDAKPSTYEVGDMNVDFELHECRVRGSKPYIQGIRYTSSAHRESQKGFPGIPDIRRSVEDKLHGE
ncbi:MAG: response regulator transcription factor [Bacillota bacterium]|nr:response regulator transcription factor [Bacillota bacterium]